MASAPTWQFAGGKVTIFGGLDDPDADFGKWCSRVVDFVLRIDASLDFEVKDNGFRRYPGILVTNGITGYLRGNPFVIWSDVPGELILCHDSMGSRLGGELIRTLEALWQ